MNISFSNFAIQCAAMGVWVFIVAGLYAMVEKVINKHFPGFLDPETAGASQPPAQARIDTVNKS